MNHLYASEKENITSVVEPDRPPRRFVYTFLGKEFDVLTLKPNCSSINFRTIEKSKENLSIIMYGVVDKENIYKEIQKNKKMVDGGHDTTGQFLKELNYLTALNGDQSYQDGKIPRGIEKIILQIMESYTFWHSISEVDSKFFLNQNNYLSSLFNISVAFMASSELAKMFNSKPDDFSLCNLWNHDVEAIRNSDISTDNEIDYISKQFRRGETTRDPAMKRFLDFRNKVIAHNSTNTGLKWEDFIVTMNFVLRVWGILDKFYSPNCFARPIQYSDQLYAPLQPHYQINEIQTMKNARLRFMKEMFDAASTNLASGEKDTIKPFGELKVTVNITPSYIA